MKYEEILWLTVYYNCHVLLKKKDEHIILRYTQAEINTVKPLAGPIRQREKRKIRNI